MLGGHCAPEFACRLLLIILNWLKWLFHLKWWCFSPSIYTYCQVPGMAWPFAPAGTPVRSHRPQVWLSIADRHHQHLGVTHTWLHDGVVKPKGGRKPGHCGVMAIWTSLSAAWSGSRLLLVCHSQKESAWYLNWEQKPQIDFPHWDSSHIPEISAI
jgi:hypothetical protein